MAFSFLQRGNLSDHVRELTLNSYEPALAIEGLVTGIDNVRHDVFLSPRFVEASRLHLAKLVARHGSVEDLAAEEPRTARLGAGTPARIRERQAQGAKPFEFNDFKRIFVDLHVAALTQVKSQGGVALDLLFRLAVLKFLRAELVTQYSVVLERCRARVKTYEGPRQSGMNNAMELRERLARFQINKRTVLRRVGQDLFNIQRDAEKEILGKTRRSLLGDAASPAYELFVNRLLFSEDAQDSLLNAEHYVMLGNYERDADRFERMREVAAGLLKALALVVDAEDSRLDGLLNAAENAQEFMAAGAPDESSAKGKAQKAILAAWVDILQEAGLMDHVVASYEVVPLLTQYSLAINPQQLKTALINKAERKRVDALLEEQGKISTENLDAAVRRVESTRPAERAKLAGRYFADFCRYHRDLRRMESVLAAMEKVNVLGSEKFRELSAVNNTLYEYLLPEEQKPAEDKIVHHVVIKADIRESTTLTRTLFEKGLNPASYFSLNFYDPINKLLPKYDARKVFIEGDAIILALLEREGEPALGVAQACVLAKEIIEVVRACNERSMADGLPTLELGIGISYQDSAPMYLMDGPRQIMISKAINESDRLSSCHKGVRKLVEKRDLLFNVFTFKTIEDADAGGNPDEFLMRYNISGVHISQAAFQKLKSEISLQGFDLQVPMIWRNSTVRVYTGLVPLAQGIFHRIIVREGRVAHVDPRDFSLKRLTEQNYYEVCLHPRIYEAIEAYQHTAAAAMAR